MSNYNDDTLPECQTAEGMREILQEALLMYSEETGAEIRYHSFQDAGVLTMNEGLVVKTGDLEFQVTIVRSR